MDLVAVRCAKCDATLGTLVNLWTQIGKKYITPVAYVEDKAEADNKITATGAVRIGDAGTLVEGCGQIIFRITSIVLKIATDLRRKAEPKIQRILQLRGQPATTQPKPSPLNSKTHPQNDGTAPSRDTFDIIQIQADLEAQQDEIQRIGAAGFQVMSTFDSTVARFEKQMRQLSDSVANVRREGEGQQADIKSLKTQMSDAKWSSGDGDAVVARLDQQLQTTDRVVTELRQIIRKSHAETSSLRSELSAAQKEIAEVKRANARLKKDADEAKQVAQEGVATAKTYASEVASLRREMSQLRSELAQQQHDNMRHSSVDEDPSISSHQLDILASNIAKIGNRASQVESLQMEFDLFRTRMQRLEARVVAGSTPNPSRKDIRPSFAEYDNVSAAEGSQSHYGSTTRQKRPPMTRDDSHIVNSTPPKRVAISSDYPTLGTAGYVSTSEQQQSSPGTMALVETPVQRRTAAASTKKSTARRGRWAKG
ncbi:hypothetical protein BBK36DRAFT_1166125 [Trichoderma citrinoviride]|uniref:Uncharacterized protein n=1 Tax=Trichoderma citrinoviride TaxID=58853 RepID=A0A2T4BKR7_9HYPO|nr:hypothetical protein BBK36DRAFT_1166125 [Trichoderma citrinoviride]PTB69908.1 hypothetical protein BBK36DRAFT_1166125 [Trichoderma citrinoviride]